MYLPKRQILTLIEEGYSSKQIAKILDLTTRQVTCFKDRNKIKTAKFDKLELTETELQIIYGCLLGDGYIDTFNKKYNYNRFVTKHGIKQKEYVYHIHTELNRITYVPKILTRHDKRFKNPEYQMIELKSIVNPLFTELRSVWYPNGKKVVPESLKELSPLAISFWYMDDGYRSNNQYVFSTNGFDKASVEKLSDIFNTQFGIKTSIWKNNCLNILSKDLFIDLLSPFIVPSMSYKLKSPHKTNLKLETPEEDNQLPTIQIPKCSIEV